MLAIWRRTIETLISLLVPPLSDKPYISKDPLGAPETDVIFKWLQLLKAFFNASENRVEHGVPLFQLQSGVYKDIIVLGQYMDLPAPALRDRASAAVKAASRGGLGGDGDNERMAEVLLRIARTRWVVPSIISMGAHRFHRSDMGDFLGKEIGMLTKARIEKQGGML